MLTKLLIANRGEIACRIIKTAKRLGIPTVAIYSEADSQSLHVKSADEAWCVGGALATESYLNIEKIIEVCRASGASAIHPGYGFLSESPSFARACAKANIIFVGPSVDAMDAMASKQLAKQLLEKSEVPLTPGYHGKDQSDSRLLQEASKIGFPVLLKAALGGGGKGMRAVENEAAFQDALIGARREAQAYFADDTMLIEKLIQNPRHVEIQLMADNHNHVVHIFERDCSIQRRHQKIIEEAPAPHLTLSLREALAKAAVAVARAIQYRGAGTVEFLVDDVNQQFYFMEMNTRLQVEHPVTEMISGLDLVEWQLRIAANESLPESQETLHATGHAIECRIYAEDPAHGFIPSVGQISILKEPAFEGIRIDSGVQHGDTISRFYDPMFAKIIAWGTTREEAILRMQQALAHYHIGGIKTNISFLQTIIKHPHFINADLSTDFLTEHVMELPEPNLDLALYMAASFDYLKAISKDPLFQATLGFQMHLKSHWNKRYKINNTTYSLKITPLTQNTLQISSHGKAVQITTSLKEGELFIQMNDRLFHAPIEAFENHLTVYTETGPINISSALYEQTLSLQHKTSNSLTAPMPATVVAILKKKGDDITTGEGIIVLEAMKMEHTIYAPMTGQLIELFYPLGSQVNEGALLATIEPLTSTKA